MFCFTYRVYYEDTDVSGVMYHARYLAFLERARTEFLRSLGFEQDRLIERYGLAFTLSDIQIQYRKPARLDDELKVSVAVEKLGAASLCFAQTICSIPDNTLLATASVRAGCVQLPEFRAARMPDPLRHALKLHWDAHVI